MKFGLVTLPTAVVAELNRNGGSCAMHLGKAEAPATTVVAEDGVFKSVRFQVTNISEEAAHAVLAFLEAGLMRPDEVGQRNGLAIASRR